MLKQLYIRNFTLIDKLDIHFSQGFSVITGETGAGKSIILGAIGMLLGQRADSRAIKNSSEKCVIEAHFDLTKYDLMHFFNNNDIEYDATDCIIRRELTASGKSRAFINDTPAPLSLLKELGEQLVDVHSQHQNLLLGKQNFQLEVVDIIAKDSVELSGYKKAFHNYKIKTEELDKLKEKIERNSTNADFLQFQYEELNNAGLKQGEQEELEQKAETMSHSEEIKNALYEADRLMSGDREGIIINLKNSLHSLNSISKVMPYVEELTQRMDACYIELKDISQDISALLDSTDFNPSELDAINSRLDKIYNLQQKYHCATVDELIVKHDELKSALDSIENSDEALAEMQKEVDIAMQQCTKAAEALSRKRKTAAVKIEKEMQQFLIPLGIPNVQFKVALENCSFNNDGSDKVAFLFSANRNTTPQPVSQVASGGEIARVMLSLKAMISGAVKLPTIIFDEIDTGVSGKIAEKMAQIMQQMGYNDRQVISITHLPQIASKGKIHYKVFKEETADGTISRMQTLNEEERIREIAQMLSGSDISEAAINNAKELLKQ